MNNIIASLLGLALLAPALADSVTHIADIETAHKNPPPNSAQIPVYWDIVNDPRTTKHKKNVFEGASTGTCVVALYFDRITERAKKAIWAEWDTGKDSLYNNSPTLSRAQRWWEPDIKTPWCLDGPPASAKNGSLGFPDGSVVFTSTQPHVKEDDGVTIILSNLSIPNAGESNSTVGNALMYYRMG